MTRSLKTPDIERILSRADPKLALVIQAVRAHRGVVRPPVSKVTPFEALVRAVIYQRLTEGAAESLFAKLRERVPLRARDVAATPAKAIHELGLAEAKAQTIVRLAQWFVDNEKTAKKLPDMTDDQIRDVLTAIDGIGSWTVNVLLIFNLNRFDVLPVGDQGIRRALQLFYDLPKPPSAAAVAEIAEQWRPYRSIASMYLWQATKFRITPQHLAGPRRASKQG